MEYGMRIFKYDDDWICEFPDLPGCTGVGNSPEEAVEDGKIAKELWQEAIQAWADGKKVIWEEDTDRRVFDRNNGWLSTKHQVQMIDQDGDAVTVRMISRGKWYVED